MHQLIKQIFEITYNWSFLKFSIIMFLNFFVFLFEFISLISIIPLIALIFENSGNNISGLNFFFKIFNVFFDELDINNLIIFVILLTILKFFFHTLSIYLQEKFTLQSIQRIQKNILHNIIKSNYGYLIKLKTSNISNYLFPEISRIRISCISLNSFLYNLLSILIFFVGSTFINIYFSIISVILGLIYFILFSPINFFYSKQGNIQRDTRNDILGRIQIVFNNFKNFKVLNKNSVFIDEISKTIEKLFRTEIKTSLVKAIVKNLYEPVLIVLCLIMIYFFFNSLTIFKFSELGALFIIFSRIFSRFATCVQSVNKFYHGKSSLAAIQEKQMSSKQNKEIYIGDEVKNIEKIEFKNCTFSYGIKNVFSNLNFTIKKNSICSIYGSSGSGKTTIADLLVGFINTTNGNIFINNKKLEDYNLFSLREKIGYVNQDSYLFDGSIRYNLILNNKIDRDKEILKILEKLQLKDLFNDEEIQLEKNIYDKALNISGGQKQRILIAREILKNPDVIIFDESLSQLHKELRLKIFGVIKSLKPNIIIINLTHNDEFKALSDQVLKI